MSSREAIYPDLVPLRTKSGLLIEEYFSRVAGLLREVDPEEVAALVQSLAEARDAGRTVYTFGNGGSAATAMHLANDLATTARPGHLPVRATCLNGNMSLFSCLANDWGYEHVFTRQLASFLEPKDVVLGISASGNSANCVNALSFGRSRGAVTLGLLGFDGGRMKALCDHAVHVACDDYLPVEDVHMAVCHAISRALRSKI